MSSALSRGGSRERFSVDEVLSRMAEAAAHGVGATRSRVRVSVSGSHDRVVAWPPDALAGPFERTVPSSSS
jgi:hypothetical protein